MLERRAARGKRTPALETRPTLYSDLRGVWQAFLGLNAQRPTGYGAPVPLTVTDITTYLVLRGFEGAELGRAFELVTSMDQEWLRWAHEKQPKRRERRHGDASGRDRR